MNTGKSTFIRCDVLHLVWKCIIILFLMILTGYSAFVAVYKIPIEKINKNVEKSIYTFSREGSYYSPADSVLDNYTDALMLLTAAYPYTENIFLAALNNTRYDIPGIDPPNSLLRIYLETETEKTSINYARYWHGYLIFLKPLLLVNDYKALRNIAVVVQLV